MDVFTRRTDPGQPDLVEVDHSYRVFHIDAGPPESAPIGDMVDWVQEFAEGVMAVLDVDPPDLVHSHYWLSGSAGLVVKRKLGIPLANVRVIGTYMGGGFGAKLETNWFAPTLTAAIAAVIGSHKARVQNLAWTASNFSCIDSMISSSTASISARSPAT